MTLLPNPDEPLAFLHHELISAVTSFSRGSTLLCRRSRTSPMSSRNDFRCILDESIRIWDRSYSPLYSISDKDWQSFCCRVVPWVWSSDWMTADETARNPEADRIESRQPETASRLWKGSLRCLSALSVHACAPVVPATVADLRSLSGD